MRLHAQGPVEYGLLIALIAVAVLVVAGTYGEALTRWFMAMIATITSRS